LLLYDCLKFINDWSGARCNAYIVEGESGSGKSHFLRHLANYLNNNLQYQNTQIKNQLINIFYLRLSEFGSKDNCFKTCIQNYLKTIVNREQRIVFLLDDLNELVDRDMKIFSKIIPLKEFTNVKVVVTNNNYRRLTYDYFTHFGRKQSPINTKIKINNFECHYICPLN